MKLLKTFKKKPFCNDFHFILIPVLLFLLSLKYWPFFIVLGLFFIYLFKKTKLLVPISLLILLFSIEVLCIKLSHKAYVPNQISAYVYEVEDDNKYIVYYKGIKILVTEYEHENAPGDYISMSIELNESFDKSYATDFDYQEYLYSRGISCSGKGITIEKKRQFFSIYSLKYLYLKYLKKHLNEESYEYVSAMVFGDNIFEDSIKDSYSILGISHILAISGLHILFLYKLICFILLKLFRYYKKAIPITLLLVYTLFIGAPPSALRAVFFLVLGIWNKKGDITYTRLDILSISMLMMLMMNPYQMYNTGFLLSYLVSFVLIFNPKKEESKLKNLYKSYYLIYFSTFPIVINMTNRISLLSFLLSPIFSLVIGFLLLPLSYLLAIFPIFDIFLKYIFIFLNSYFISLSEYSLFIPFPSISIYYMALYYVLFLFLILFILKKKSILSPLLTLSIYLLILCNVRYLNPYTKVTFLDCGQGDSALIELPNGKGVILIDAYNSYDYLKSLGLRRIDCIIFTHSDNDHIGDYEEIFTSFKVEKAYYPTYDTKFNTLMKEYSITPIEAENEIRIRNLKLQIYGPIYPYEDPNSNSIVFSLKIDQTKYLFTGDMTKKEEEDILKQYLKEIDADILKVAHHGSNTSSTVDFIKAVSPKYSIISVGKKNSYGLPDQEILARLKEYSQVYLTYQRGNITFYHRKGKVHISTYR